MNCVLVRRQEPPSVRERGSPASPRACAGFPSERQGSRSLTSRRGLSEGRDLSFSSHFYFCGKTYITQNSPFLGVRFSGRRPMHSRAPTTTADPQNPLPSQVEAPSPLTTNSPSPSQGAWQPRSTSRLHQSDHARRLSSVGLYSVCSSTSGLFHSV